MKKLLLLLFLISCSPAQNTQPNDDHKWKKLLNLQHRMEKLEEEVDANLSHFEMRINILDRDVTSTLSEMERRMDSK